MILTGILIPPLKQRMTPERLLIAKAGNHRSGSDNLQEIVERDFSHSYIAVVKLALAKEVKMALDLFDKPIYAQSRHFIQELVGLDDAFDFLEDWPLDQRDLAFEAVVRSLREAACYRRPLSLAEEDFRRFLKRSGKLAAIEDIPAYRIKDRNHNIGGL